MSGTDIGYAPFIVLRMRYAMSGTDIRDAGTRLLRRSWCGCARCRGKRAVAATGRGRVFPSHYAVWGTDEGYGGHCQSTVFGAELGYEALSGTEASGDECLVLKAIAWYQVKGLRNDKAEMARKEQAR
eukprot:885949-Rhodomonas_salina.2